MSQLYYGRIWGSFGVVVGKIPVACDMTIATTANDGHGSRAGFLRADERTMTRKY